MARSQSPLEFRRANPCRSRLSGRRQRDRARYTIDDFYTGLKDGRTIAFVAPPAYDPKPHAPPGFSLIFDDEFNDSRTIDVNNTQKDGYKWYVKGMWFPSTVSVDV